MDFLVAHLSWLVPVLIIVAISSTLYWMLHPPVSRTVQIATSAAEQAEEIAGNVLVVFTADIKSEVLMALATRMAKGQHAQLVAIYIIEVPLTLPVDAELPVQEREALGMLNAATEIGRKFGLEIRTRTIRDRNAGAAIIQAAREENARLIVIGTYREHRYAGAPLAKVIEFVTTHSHVDVLVGVISSDESKSMLRLGGPAASAQKGTNKK